MSRHDPASSLNDMLNFAQKAVRFCEASRATSSSRMKYYNLQSSE
jgi:hypothetical protein